jgi:hypothetical protein
MADVNYSMLLVGLLGARVGWLWGPGFEKNSYGFRDFICFVKSVEFSFLERLVGGLGFFFGNCLDCGGFATFHFEFLLGSNFIF